MKKITLFSHYNNFQLNLRVSESVYNVLLLSGDAIAFVNEDIDRYRLRVRPLLLSIGQCKKISNFFADGAADYFDYVEL